MVRTHVCACVKALCAVSGVEEEGLVPLHLRELVAQSLNLYS